METRFDAGGESGWAEKNTTSPGRSSGAPAGKSRAKKDSDSVSDWLYIDKSGKKQHKNKCRSESKDLGCNQYFQPDQFNFSTGVCNGCAARFARSIGIAYEWVSYAALIQDRYLAWYTDKVPTLANFTHREQIRMILIALNIDVQQKTMDESEGGAYLRDNVKSVGYSSKQIGLLAK